MNEYVICFKVVGTVRAASEEDAKERLEDCRHMTEKFLEEAELSHGLEGLRVESVSEEAVPLFQSHGVMKSGPAKGKMADDPTAAQKPRRFQVLYFDGCNGMTRGDLVNAVPRGYVKSGQDGVWSNESGDVFLVEVRDDRARDLEDDDHLEEG